MQGVWAGDHDADARCHRRLYERERMVVTRHEPLTGTHSTVLPNEIRNLVEAFPCLKFLRGVVVGHAWLTLIVTTIDVAVVLLNGPMGAMRLNIVLAVVAFTVEFIITTSCQEKFASAVENVIFTVSV